ncbi:hypothetical protein LCGC14_1923120, partial [marine sediment metagenome]
MKRFVVLSDLHAHPWSAFAWGDGLGNTRLRRSLDVLDASLERAQADNIPWFFIGDLVHTAGYAINTVLSGITEIFLRYHGVTKVAVWGNHDARGVGGKITVDQTVFGALYQHVTLLDPSILSEPVIVDGIQVAGAGFQPRVSLLDEVPRAEIGLYHQTVIGSTVPNGFVLDEDGLDPQLLLSRHRLSIVGDIHHPQQIDAPPGQGILIPGSPEHHNFGDKGEHGWWVVTLPDEKEHSDDCSLGLAAAAGCDCAAGVPDINLEFVPGGSPEFRTVNTPADAASDGHFYRVRTVRKGETLPDNVTAIAPTPTTIEHRDVLQGASETEHILQAWLKTQPPPKGEDPTAYLAAGRELLVAQNIPRMRDMRLTELHLHNFCSFADQPMTIKPGVWFIGGQGRDYPSNGAGKSTLIGESLYWLLFGQTTKGLSADEVIRWGESACFVTATILIAAAEDEDGYLMVTRRRDKDGYTLSVVQDSTPWEAESVHAMTTKLGAYLGITPDIFQSLAYFSQEKLLLFSSATDGERKNVLADLIGLRAYQDAATAATTQWTTQVNKQITLAARLELLGEHICTLEDTARGYATQTLQWDQAQAGVVQQAQASCFQATTTADELIEATEARIARLVRWADEAITRRRVYLDTTRATVTTDIRVAAAQESCAAVVAAQERLKAYEVSIVAANFASVDAARQAIKGLTRQQAELVEVEKNCTAVSDGRRALEQMLHKVRTERDVLDEAARQGVDAFTVAKKTLEAGKC